MVIIDACLPEISWMPSYLSLKPTMEKKKKKTNHDFSSKTESSVIMQ